MPVARKLFTILLAMALAAALPAFPGATATGTAPDSAQPSQYLGAVTLITGDQVSVRRVGERLVPNVLPAPGREHIHFATVGTGDELSIVPSDAWAPLNAGRLDRRLFDVAALLRDGYGDAGRADLPLIVQSGGPAALTDAGATVTHTLSSVDATAVRQPKESTADFWSAHRDAGKIWLDGVRRPSLDSSVPQIGAPTAWRTGYTGRDVTVAVLDTGIDDTHPDLRHRIAGVKNFIPGTDIKDTAGHGTHVAATIAGTGRASNGRYTGVAPDARLLIGKVCEGGCPESAILAGMEWAAAAGAKVVNLSLGGPDTADDDPLELAVNRLAAQHGTLFVIAAGNDGGYGAETVSSPASADAALAVGAVDSDDVHAGFSSRGPRVRDAALKPEIVAPGVEITAGRSRFSGLGKKGDRYVALSGTSMATPHVAGAAAILAQQHPDWTGPRLKAALMSSAEPLAGTGTYAQGAGRVDVARAIAQGVHSQPTGVSLGRMAWPHEDDQPVTRTVTYHNPGPAPVTLRLSVTATGPDGEPVPDGMFRLSAEEITVPAGGQSGVDITANTAIPAAEGTFGAHIDAVDGAGLRVTTPVGRAA